LKRAFYNIGLDPETNIKQAYLVLKRFDSNFDANLTFSDILEMFAPRFELDLLQELEKRSLFDVPQKTELNQYTRGYVRDVIDLIIRVEEIVDKIKV
jgi:hypothetical protein